MLFLGTENLIFITDTTVEKHIKSKTEIMAKLIDYQLQRKDSHKKIYLPPSVLKILKKTNDREIRAQIENLFISIVSIEDENVGVFPEVCITAECLKNNEGEAKVVFLTDNKKFHDEKHKSALKIDYGVHVVIDFDGLNAILINN